MEEIAQSLEGLDRPLADLDMTPGGQVFAVTEKFGHIRRVNTMLGLFVPALVTPLELLGGDNETDQG